MAQSDGEKVDKPADLEIKHHFKADPNQYLEWSGFQLAKMFSGSDSKDGEYSNIKGSPLRIEQCSRCPTVLRLFYLGIYEDLHCKPIVQGDLQLEVNPIRGLGRCWGHRQRFWLLRPHQQLPVPDQQSSGRVDGFVAKGNKCNKQNHVVHKLGFQPFLGGGVVSKTCFDFIWGDDDPQWHWQHVYSGGWSHQQIDQSKTNTSVYVTWCYVHMQKKMECNQQNWPSRSSAWPTRFGFNELWSHSR